MFQVNLNPYVDGKKSKKDINDNIFAALLIILIYSIGVHYYIYNLSYAVKIVLMALTSFYSAKYVNIFYYTKITDLPYKEAKVHASKSNLTVMSLLLVMVLPVGTPLWVVAIGALLMVVFSKLVLVETGKHITNPVIITRILLITLLGSYVAIPFVASPGNWLLDTVFGSSFFNWLQVAGTGVDSVSGVTALNYLAIDTTFQQASTDINWLYMLFGLSGGAIGETSRLLVLLLGLYLIRNKVIDWITPVTIIGSVFVYMLIYGLMKGFGLWFPVYEVMSGALIFAAFFIATDPYTSPKENIGKILYGTIIGSFIVLIRLITPYPEGVMFAILIGGIVSPMLIKRYVGTQVADGAYVNTIVKSTKEEQVETIQKLSIIGVSTIVILIIFFLFGTVTAANADEHGEFELEYLNNTIIPIEDYVESNNHVYTYIVDGKYEQSIELAVAINTVTKKIDYVEVWSHKETEGIGSNIVDDPSFLKQFEGLPLDIHYELDVIAGATMSSTAVGTAVKEAILAYQGA